MSKYTQHGYDQNSWQDQQSIVPGVTKNGLIFIAIALILGIAFYSLDWDRIATFW